MPRTGYTRNGAPRISEAPGDRILIHALRQVLGLTGTKLGCGLGACGSCTVLLDGAAVQTCATLQSVVAGRSKFNVSRASGWARRQEAGVAEVNVEASGRWRLRRIAGTVECRLVVKPSAPEVQAQGSVVWGRSALRTAATFWGGRIQENDCREFPVLPFRDMPPVDVPFIPRHDHPTASGRLPAATVGRLCTLPLSETI